MAERKSDIVEDVLQVKVNSESSQIVPETPEVNFIPKAVETSAKKPRVVKQKEALKILQEPEVSFKIPDFGNEVSWQEHLKALKDEQSRLSRIEKTQEFAAVNIKSHLPIGIVLASDWHLGSAGTDYEAWGKDMELIKKEPQVFMVTLSNTVDNFVFPSGMFEQLIKPSAQHDMMIKFAEDYKSKILAVIGSRCHEGWTKDKADVDVNKLMFQKIIGEGVPFMPKGGVLEINLNDITYSFTLVHKAKGHSALNPTNASRRLHDERMPGDIVAVAHNHVKEILQKPKYEGKFLKQVLFARTGTYKIDDGYGQLEGFGKGQLGNPMVVLFPDKKHFIGFYDIADGISYLEMCRKFDTIKQLAN